MTKKLNLIACKMVKCYNPSIRGECYKKQTAAIQNPEITQGGQKTKVSYQVNSDGSTTTSVTDANGAEKDL